MSITYLMVPFAQRQSAKALGARWDASEKRWFVPEGRDLGPFAAWLPASATMAAVVPATAAGVEQAVVEAKSRVSLSQLLAGVANAVSQTYRAGVWTIVDVVQATIRTHVYLEVAERDAEGVVLAKARAVIWARAAERILPPFEAATGMSLGPGIKLLVRARPMFSAQYGFSIEVDAIDPDYSLGDLEARKREIRARLQREGLWDNNRSLEFPWDFNNVLVIAPQGAAGLGDFQSEATRLASAGVCTFEYAYSRFQGEGAAASIRATASAALVSWKERLGTSPDVVVLIRGGGAVNDLAWLNDYELAKFVCCVEIPVLTGIGHERDSTILDEVAHTRFDTPSKVIAGIEAVIRRRTQEAQAAYESVVGTAFRCLAEARAMVEGTNAAVQAAARKELTLQRQSIEEAVADVRLQATRCIHSASMLARDRADAVRNQAARQIALARHDLPAAISEIRAATTARIGAARSQSERRLDFVLARVQSDTRAVAAQLHGAMSDVAHDARRGVRRAGESTEALIREISGQGPQKTLGRGFALVRGRDGQTVTTAANAPAGAALSIEFRDGVALVHVDQKEKS